jgi:hypothetical protein
MAQNWQNLPDLPDSDKNWLAMRGYCEVYKENWL